MPRISQGDALGWYAPRRWRDSGNHCCFQHKSPDLDTHTAAHTARGACQPGLLLLYFPTWILARRHHSYIAARTF